MNTHTNTHSNMWVLRPNFHCKSFKMQRNSLDNSKIRFLSHVNWAMIFFKWKQITFYVKSKQAKLEYWSIVRPCADSLLFKSREMNKSSFVIDIVPVSYNRFKWKFKSNECAFSEIDASSLYFHFPVFSIQF